MPSVNERNAFALTIFSSSPSSTSVRISLIKKVTGPTRNRFIWQTFQICWLCIEIKNFISIDYKLCFFNKSFFFISRNCKYNIRII